MDAKEDNKPLISIIVPTYNVEKYVRKCLDSLKYQSMKQIEVICIDDGSTDNSGRIADEYKSEGWPIFRVIHTENKGLSAARNRGIDEAEADWLMFVDSDDWVDKDFCRVPYEAVLEKKVDMAIFRAYEVCEDIPRLETADIPVGLVDEYSAYEYGKNTVWRRICKKDLFNNVRFPEARVYEDVATTYKLVHNAKRLVILNNHLYYHIHREDSITNCQSNENRRDAMVAEMERSINIISYGYPEEKIQPSLLSIAIRYLSRIKPCNDEIYNKAGEIVRNKRGHEKGLTIKESIGCFVWNVNPHLFCYICVLLGRMK